MPYLEELRDRATLEATVVVVETTEYASSAAETYRILRRKDYNQIVSRNKNYSDYLHISSNFFLFFLQVFWL